MKVHINGIDLAYSDQGQGAPLVLIHAFPLNRAMWEPQVQALATHHRIITVDLRGHGESDAPMWHYTLEQFADDVKALLDHLTVSQATFVGLSMGGYTLFALYRKYPERVKALVLADTRAQADTEEGKAGRFAMAQTAYTKGAKAIADLMLPKLLSQASLEKRPDLVDTLRGIIMRNQISGIVGDLMAMAERPDSTSLLKDMTCPTLVIVGQDDVATPPSEAKFMAEKIPHSRLEIIPNAGHASNLEQPEAFNSVLQSFLKTIPQSP